MKQTNSLSSRPSSRRFWVWILLLLLSATLFHGLVSLPPPGDTNPTFHAASRYLDRSADETGFTCSFLAVLLDYRSFDLVLLSLFFMSVTLMALLLSAVENLPLRVSGRVWTWASLSSSLTLLVVGSIGLKDGSNFMDYEFWAGVFGSSARAYGAWITGGLVLLTVASSLISVWKVWTHGKEKRLGH
ncbi:MAG TPA: hypothetical protein VN963_00440 [bacterium]|nr:hypothetical protein [bacterium]